MKNVVQLIALGWLVAAASCNAGAVAPSRDIGTALGATTSDAFPPTVHVIPMYSYGKLGYELPGTGGFGGLIGSAESLYGATEFGGNASCSTPFNSGSNSGCGIVYRLVPGARKRKYKIDVLHTFNGAPRDGAVSFASLFADGTGDLYGTTFYGGKYNGGTLFKLHPSSSGYRESIVHSFGHGKDGAYPVSEVIEANGILYGTTMGGGKVTNKVCQTKGGSPNATCGTLYSVDPATGAEHVLHSFGSKFADGLTPWAAPLYVNGTLYGTTYLGGSVTLCGSVYKIGTDGKGEKIIHNFQNNPYDGCDPLSSLILANGLLYGTTCCGGGYYCSHCEGTIFSVDPSTGKEAVLHNFGYSTDGSQPVAALVDVNGVLYGTAAAGGGTSCHSGIGCGVIYSYAPSSSNPAYKVLYDFTGSNDGAGPRAGLLYTGGTFYGTTVYAGKKGLGTAVRVRL